MNHPKWFIYAKAEQQKFGLLAFSVLANALERRPDRVASRGIARHARANADRHRLPTLPTQAPTGFPRYAAPDLCDPRRAAATLLAGGQSVEEVCKKLEVSPPTYHRWRQEYGGAKEETVKRLKALKKENGQLKKLVADLSLDKAMLKELVEGKW